MSKENIKRISLWSGPRNISTTLMYSFAERKDTKVFDEPLYAYYLKTYPDAKTYHPGADKILNTMEADGNKVVEMMLTDTSKPVLFFKNMTHHLQGLDRHFLKDTVNIILTRDPKEMIPSYAKVISNPKLHDVGYKMHAELVEDLQKREIPVVVVDAKKVLLNPDKQLQKLCAYVGIPFDDSMLKWPSGPRPEDGSWANYWYANVHNSTGFLPYVPKKEKFPEHLESLLQECLPYYNQLQELTL